MQTRGAGGMGLEKLTRRHRDPEQSVQELVYNLRSHCDAIRTTKTVRPYRMVICPVKENNAALMVSDGRVMLWELKAHTGRTPANPSSGLSPLYSTVSFCGSLLGPNQKRIQDLSLNSMIGQTLIVGEAPPPTSNQQEVKLKFLLTGLLSGLQLPFAIRMCPPLTTKNINHHQPLLAVGRVDSWMEEYLVEEKSNSSSKMSSSTEMGVEKVANFVLFPCKYASSGCEVTLPHTNKTEHEELCEFQPYSCPCPSTSCKWQGSLDAVMPHLMHQHKSITTGQGEDIMFLATDINLPGELGWLMMQSCFGFHFMLVLEKRERYNGHHQFFAIMQLIGTRKQAENLAYRLELNGHEHRLIWEARPRSIHEGIDTAIMNSSCLVFDTSIAQLFTENGDLNINVTIFKDV